MKSLSVPNHFNTHGTTLVQSCTHLVHLDEGLQLLLVLFSCEGLPLWKIWIYLIREDLVCKKMIKLIFFQCLIVLIPKG